MHYFGTLYALVVAAEWLLYVGIAILVVAIALYVGYVLGFKDGEREALIDEALNNGTGADVCGEAHMFAGYYCTRKRGHAGPCALHPLSEQGVVRLRKYPGSGDQRTGRISF